MPKEIVFSPHALEQISERGLSPQQVVQVVREPDQIIESGVRPIAQRRVREAGREYLLRVAYEDSAQAIRIVTAYRTSKIAKYWRGE